jgi:hypothetical protein
MPVIGILNTKVDITAKKRSEDESDPGYDLVIKAYPNVDTGFCSETRVYVVSSDEIEAIINSLQEAREKVSHYEAWKRMQ